jgi:hypothetical protein
MASLSRAFKQKNITPWQERIAEAVVILMLCVQPLYFNEHRYRGLTGHKYNFFFVCMCVILCTVVLVLIAKLIGKQKLISLKNLTIADWAVLGFALVTLVSALFSPYRDVVDVWNGIPERHDGVYTQLFYVAIFLIIAHWYKPRVRDFGIFGISAIAIGLIGIFQFYGMDFFKLWPNEPGGGYEVENFYNIFFRSTLGNINMVATYVCVAILLCGFLYVKMDTSKLRYVWLAGSASCFWLMLIGGSESGMVGVLVTVILTVPFIIQSREYIGRFLILGSSWLGVFTLQKLLYDMCILETETAGKIALYAVITALPLAGSLMLTLLLKKKNEDKTERPVKWKAGVVFIVGVIAVGLISVEIFGRHTEDFGGFYPKGDAALELTTEQVRREYFSMLVTGHEGVEIRVEPFVEADVDYRISARVRLKTPESAELIMRAQIGDSDSDFEVRSIRTETVTDSEWTRLRGWLTLSNEDMESDFIAVYIESDDETAEFYVDSFWFSTEEIFIDFSDIPWRPFYEAREMLHGRAHGTFGSSRIHIWQSALEAFPIGNPLIGSGPDTFWYTLPIEAHQLTPGFLGYDKAHNEYLQILICQGILGLLCYLVFLGYLLFKTVPRAFKNPLLMAVLIGFAGYCVQAFFNISLPIASQMLWVIAGMLAGYLRVDKQKKM